MRRFMRGDLCYADLNPVVGSEQGGIRPVLIVQNDIGNRYSPTLLVAAVTGTHPKKNLPTHIKVDTNGNGLYENSIILLEQVRTIDRRRILQYIGHLGDSTMQEVDNALKISFGLKN